MNKIVIILSFILIAGCSKKRKPDELTYLNDFEQISGWFDASHVVKGQAHSGFYSNLIDSSAIYGTTFKKVFPDISSKKLKKIKVSAWVFVKDVNVDGRLVVDVQDSTGKSFNWQGFNTRDFIRNANEWTQITGEVNILPNIPQTKDYKVIAFGWNVGGKLPFWIDDIEISFE